MKSLSDELKDMVALCTQLRNKAEKQEVSMTTWEIDDLIDDIDNAKIALKSNNTSKINAALQVLQDYRR